MTKTPPPKIPDDQKTFSHGHNIALESFAESLFGRKFYHSANRVDIGFWKKFYITTFDVLDTSVFRSIGAIDRPHKQALQNEITHALSILRVAKTKDEIHGALIVSLLKLVFLLLGRRPYYARGKWRSLSTFRTLTYSQTEEQLSWLLQGHMQKTAQEHGFGDHFDADFAFLSWSKENKKKPSDRSAYVEWVKLNFPETFANLDEALPQLCVPLKSINPQILTSPPFSPTLLPWGSANTP